ncbi:ABC transporter ATP-binding protein [Agrobacterium pusense]|uniref:ABC transporter ATP-binding protein n=1 Tax=Agrobacterium pusense TaxID=648995 RepID=UPI001C6E9B92|nr:ABC transporter ATP-binding protein [Agrobacterium pusense]MBW9070169.1 ABC transporter ATP-binding protein [Agrobacterium pusense]MBW9084991.1 ABC transporter ATP-binding protein [Agrobacterium pusense]MBW9125534.1 ABC transporter ATP-binding protein [Agrobacterium pusense]MBW9137949.1 ABC transporter ATP-binding protein [Agrobacterium pusense]
MASVEFQNVSKSFGHFHAVPDISFQISDGEFVCLLGPSGCGKTTSLRMIAGLETPTSGKVLIGGKDVTYLHPKDRQISMVFQDYALYPHMNLADNIAYPLKVRGESEEKRHARAKQVADVLKIGDLMKRLPSQISGGQQQRTSLARALVYPSQVYLFDEPLSNLDAKLRLEARGFLNHLQRDMGMTAVYVTHDQAEAMALATRIAVMDKGRIVQFAPPIEIYRRPATTFVANFVGNPPMNLVSTDAMVADGNLQLRADGLTLPGLPVSDAIAAAADRGRMTLGVRPEHLRIAQAGDENTITGKLFANENMGPESLVTMEREDAGRVTARIFTDDEIRVNEVVTLAFDIRHVTLFDDAGIRIPDIDE